MSGRLVLFILGRTLLSAGALLLLPLFFSLYDRSADVLVFGLSSLGVMAVGILLLAAGREHRRQLRAREGAVLMVCIWCALGAVGMLPYLCTGQLNGIDAFFESVSGFTTTGASCLPADASRALVLWRSMTQWLGGLNIIILLVTIIPQVSGCFGISLSVHQSISFSQMIGRMRRVAAGVSLVYLGVSLLAVLLYLLCGLGLFDALNWSLVTLSTSGCYDADSLRQGGWLMQLVTGLCMLCASGNFLLYWKAAQRRDLISLLRDAELRAFCLVLVIAGGLVSWSLWHRHLYGLADSLRYGFFQVISFASTTGIFLDDVSSWPDFTRYILFILVFMGGCIGSSTGGLKVMRLLVLGKMAAAGMRRTLHPHIVLNIVVDHVTVPMKTVGRILSFFFLYMMVFFLSVLVISLSGMTVPEAMGTAAGCLGSVAAAARLQGNVGSYVMFPAWLKLFCCFLMILGKLEIFSFLIVLQTGLRHLRHRW